MHTLYRAGIEFLHSCPLQQFYAPIRFTNKVAFLGNLMEWHLPATQCMVNIPTVTIGFIFKTWFNILWTWRFPISENLFWRPLICRRHALFFLYIDLFNAYIDLQNVPQRFSISNRLILMYWFHNILFVMLWSFRVNKAFSRSLRLIASDWALSWPFYLVFQCLSFVLRHPAV